MESLFTSIDYKDPIWIAIAFLFGALSRGVGLPPLVGFLLAGFGLNYIGVESGVFLDEMADLGIALLLFSIGLKLKVKELLHVEVWGSALTHMLIFSAFSIAAVLLLKEAGFPLFDQLSLVNAFLISFALSFSSTVFVVKAVEERGDFLSRYGQIAISILIIQDLVAVIYLGVSEAKIPSIWTLALLVLIFIGRPLIIKLSTKIGHGELLLLFGLSMALGGSALFEAVDMKADLGALAFGILLANTPKADELAKALFGIKELFLVGFFLSIGMAGLPGPETLIVVPVLLTLLTIKSGLFFLLLSRFKVRPYPASNASMMLGNYSEFGLIVTTVATSKGWLPTEWLVVMVVLVAASFVISSILNKRFDVLFSKFQEGLKNFQHKELPDNEFAVDLTDVDILICGMGRVGSGAYDHLKKYKNVIGLDFDKQVVETQSRHGRKIFYADTSDPEFWCQSDIKNSKVEWIFLCAPNVVANKATAALIRQWGFKGKIIATSVYPDEEKELLENGVDAVFNVYAEAGAGLALHGFKIFQDTSTGTSDKQ